MKKLILPIFVLLLLFTTPVNVFAQFPSNCWDIMQDNSCLRNFTECNINCPSTGDQRQRVCQDACNKTSKACSDEQVANYKACVNASRKASDAQEVKQLQPSVSPISAPEDTTKNQSSEPTDQQKVTPPVQDLKDDKEDKPIFKFPVFINEWFKITSDLIRMQLGISGFVDMWVEHESPVDWPKTYLKKDPNDLSDMPKPWPDVQIKLSQQNNWSSLKQEDSIPPGSTISGAEPFKIDLENGATSVLGTSGQTTIKTPDSTGYYYLQEGSVEVLKQSDSEEGTIFGVETPIGTVTVVHTHFFVSYDKKTSEMTVIVYDGKVEVKTKDGKRTIVSSSGDKPGVVIVSQKLSPVKLGITGLVVAVIIGGVFMLLKKKFASKVKKKK